MNIDYTKVDKGDFRCSWVALKLDEGKYVFINSRGQIISSDRKRNKLKNCFRYAEVFDNNMLAGYMPAQLQFVRERGDLFIREEGNICLYNNGESLGKNYSEIFDEKGCCIGYSNGKNTFKIVRVGDKSNLVWDKYLEDIGNSVEKYIMNPAMSYYVDSDTRVARDICFYRDEKLNDDYRVIDYGDHNKTIYSVLEDKDLGFRFKDWMYLGGGIVAIDRLANQDFVMYNLNFKACEEIDDKHLLLIKDVDGVESYFISDHNCKILSKLDSRIEYVDEAKIIDTDPRFSDTKFVREKYSIVKDLSHEKWFLVDGVLEKKIFVCQNENTLKYWDIDNDAVYVTYEYVDGKFVPKEEVKSDKAPNIIDDIFAYKKPSKGVLHSHIPVLEKTDKDTKESSIDIDEEENKTSNTSENSSEDKLQRKKRLVEILNNLGTDRER